MAGEEKQAEVGEEEFAEAEQEEETAEVAHPTEQQQSNCHERLREEFAVGVCDS